MSNEMKDWLNEQKEDIAIFCTEFGISAEEYLNPTADTIAQIRDVYETKKAEEKVQFHM